MIYITGDVHGYFGRVRRFAKEFNTSSEDVLIILGDASINFFGDYTDIKLKKRLKNTPLTLFCIHGNHEARPSTIDSYHKDEFYGGKVYVEDEYPNIKFAIDGEVYDFDGYSTLVIGGAYSVDKEWRLEDGRMWFADEQPDSKIKAKVENVLLKRKHEIDVILSHTAPYNHRPVEAFLNVIDQESVDTSTEEWLQEIAEDNRFKRWYYGHFHINKRHDPYRCIFKDVEKFMSDEIVYSTEDDLLKLQEQSGYTK